jgi:hypothetical protein
MFERDNNHLCATLAHMDTEARRRTRFNQNEAKAKMAEWLQQDRRFDDFDHGRVIDAVYRAKQSGGVLQLDDPFLRKNGSPRPAARKGFASGV